MKVVYPVCCGVDVHKSFLVGTIISTDGIQPKYQKKLFSTYNGDLHRFADWLHSNNCLDVCMESTGKYWVPVFNHKMMSTGEIWNPSDLYKVDMPQALREKQLTKAVKEATRFLEKQGLTVA